MKPNMPKEYIEGVKEERIFCSTCGDVTDGHPEMDKCEAEILENGFTTIYIIS